MQDAGWDVQASWTGGVDGPTMDPSQLDTYQSTFDECSASSGWDHANDWGSWDDDQIVALYDAEVEAHECFVGIGFDSGEPPSREVFLETFHTSKQYYAFEPGINSLVAGDYAGTLGQCPPPTWFPQGAW